MDAAWEVEWQTGLLQTAIDNLCRRVEPKKFQIFDFYVNKEWSPKKISERFQVSTDLVYQTKLKPT